MQSKVCSRCGQTKSATREFFGSTPSGGLRGYCRACMNKVSRQYEESNKDSRRLRDAKRAILDQNGRAGFDVTTKRTLLKKQGGLCACCLRPITSPYGAEVDHVVPLSKGGRHDGSNFMIAHAQCNKEKHNKTLVEHWEWRVKVGLDAENLGVKYGLFS